ncbi:pilus assembly protein [Spartinivicinus poritis]|uniref:PilC/PilY family type IV pilus protein n=1 Tax=Spartinivicinus poritis TaxID=2994640 RepID=A0ABT5U2E2_9GAMM|nr:PilC/PilY family type IV pilus protein [Spartinivicinus sp. A2-2]MDE1460537.1 PilC/PilY family type IV pilus protein [Spartinivicinus sp. A2-2]
MNNITKISFSSIIFTSVFFLSSQLNADDTEVFLTETNTPNVLLILDSSGSMGYAVNPPANYASNFDLKGLGGSHSISDGRTRIKVVRDAAADLVANINNVNLGIMRFNTTAHGGYVIADFTELTEDTDDSVRTNLINTIYNVGARNGTPLAETMYEAYRKFTGQSSRYNRGTRYTSPFKACQSNSIVYFTDGAPSVDNESDSDIKSLLPRGRWSVPVQNLPAGFINDPKPAGTPATPQSLPLSRNCRGPNSGESDATTRSDCLKELAWYLNNTDLNTSLSGTQNVTTHTIGGFGLSYNKSLQIISAAFHGGGTFSSATTPQEIKKALASAVQTAAAQGSTMAPPSVPVSSFNVLSLTKDLYYPLFKPKAGPNWPGNLKHYKFNDDGDIVDANNNPAIDSGFFKSTSKSYWSKTTDGDDVEKGGALDQLSSTRNLFTFTEDSTTTPPTITDINLSTSIDYAAFGLAGSGSPQAERDELINWVKGVIGDPLHSGLQVVTYHKDNSNPNNKKLDATAFFGTNLGFLHAFNVSTTEVTSSSGTTETRETTDSGKEQFAYIPQQLVKNIKTYKDNIDYKQKTALKVYGLDGPIDVWVNDKNRNGNILTSSGLNSSAESGEHVYLYAGMRRGGRTLFAFDVTKRNQPKLLWKKTHTDTDYKELGYTWSKPKVMKIRWGSGTKVVLIFGGGYVENNTSRDIKGNTSESTTGRAIYIADAKTGDILWWASSDASANLTLAEMKYSIPGEISGIDVNGDDLVDKLFASDIGGQIWRFDIPLDKSTNVDSSSIKGGRIANFGSSIAADAKRFFEMPDVSFVQERGKQTYFIIAIGSGNRAFPKSDSSINDRFYVIKNYDVFSVPNSYTTITESDLYNATSNTIGTAIGQAKISATNELNSKKGWYIDLNFSHGEKSLSRSTTFEGILMFTTYSPPSNLGIDTTSCSGYTGDNRLYLLNILDGTSFLSASDATGLNTETKNGRIIVKLDSGGIPPTPFVYPKSNEAGKGKIIVGTEDVTKLPIGDRITKTFWRDNKNN